MDENERWRQRFANYKKALAQLAQAVALSEQRPLSVLEEQGLIQGFEYTYELAWNTLKDFLESQGNENLYGARDTIREAFRLALIRDGDTWMQMFKDRNKTSHTYNQITANEIALAIRHYYYPLFLELNDKMDSIKP